MSAQDPQIPSTGPKLLPVFTELVNSSPIPVAVFDRDLNYIAYNSLWLTAFNLSPGNLVGKNHYKTFPEISDEWKELYKRCLQGETLSHKADSFPRGSGRLDDTSWSMSPWHTDQGEIGGLILYSHVVTERIETRKLLAEQEDFIRDFFQTSPIGLNLCTMEGLWLESNQAFLDIIGYSSEEADGGLTYWELTPSEYEEQEQVQLENLGKTGRYGPYEKEFIRKDGSKVPVRLNGFIIEREGRKYIWSFIEDITEWKQLEESLETEKMKNIQAGKMSILGEMLAGIAHEINNPLMVVDGYAQVLPILFQKNQMSEIESALGDIQKASHRASEIVNNLRKFARDESKQEPSSHQIGELIDDALGLVKSRLINYGFSLDVSIERDIKILCRPTEFAQILTNLLVNSFQARRDADEKWIRLHSEPTAGGKRVRIIVEDSGTGIPAAVAEKVFQPFYTTKPVGEGTGLGLSISKGMMEAMGGTLSYEPAANTRFIIEADVEPN